MHFCVGFENKFVWLLLAKIVYTPAALLDILLHYIRHAFILERVPDLLLIERNLLEYLLRLLHVSAFRYS